ncbi:hypothetical protein TNCV_3202231 [Trichonephila clavipes]|nr:hypothetical protein TNCV_3202231 [Trichonephila clavipes]
MKLRDRDQQVLSKEIRKNQPKSMAHITPGEPTSIWDSCFDKYHLQGTIFTWFPWLCCHPQAFDCKIQPCCSVEMLQGTSKLDLR